MGQVLFSLKSKSGACKILLGNGRMVSCSGMDAVRKSRMCGTKKQKPS